MSPRVSVVLPTYNRGNVLPRAIASALTQTFTDFELLVVDDGSTDRTVDIVRGIGDPRVRLIEGTANRGPSAARNRGIGEARGELVAFLDSDDEWLPRKLELQLARLDRDTDPGTTAVYCRFRKYDDLAQRVVRELDSPREGALFRDLLAGWHPPTTSLFLVRRAALLEVGGFDETLPCAEDYDLWLRLAQASHRFAAADEVLAVKHENAGLQLSTNTTAKLRGNHRLDEKWRPVITHHLGPAAYRKWRRRRYTVLQYAYLVEAKRAAESHHRRATWRCCLAMLKVLPRSRSYVAQALALAILGPRAYRAVATWRAAIAGRFALQ